MHNPFQKEETPEAISDINVVPLADVSLVLLIILLLLSPMMAQSMLHVKTAAKEGDYPATPNLPEPAAPQKAPEMVLVVDIGPKGIAIGSTVYPSEAELTAFLKDELPRRNDRKVFLAPYPDVTHGEVVHWLEALKACGADSVALVQTQETAP